MNRPALPTRVLARLLSLDAEAADLWSEGDLADILRHQLGAPIVFDLAKIASSERLDAGMLASVPIRTFRELLLNGEPPLALLVLTKDFAKAARVDPDRPLPGAVATVLYYASIAAARLRLGKRISSLSQQDLVGGAAWALEQDWIDRDLKELFGEMVRADGDDFT